MEDRTNVALTIQQFSPSSISVLFYAILQYFIKVIIPKVNI